MRKMKLSEIKISEDFAKTSPSKKKINECEGNWNNFHRQDRYIVVDHNNTLIDGYIQYLVLMKHKEEYAQVKISNCKKKYWYRKNTDGWNIPRYKDNPTTYIYGVHPNNNCVRQFVWRVPENWKGFEKNVQIGDTVLCATKFGYTPIVVTKIGMLDKPPIDIPIKKVCNKKILRNGIVVSY